jgi:hypothetical protein
MYTIRAFHSLSRLLLIAGPLLLISGCGEGNPLGRRSVSGNVTFQGQPIEYGAIRFEPTDQAKGVEAGAVINQGKYTIGEELGLPPGSYKVWITAQEPVPEAPTEEAPGETPRVRARDRIPAQYNVQTTLVAEVPASGETKIDFDLK